MSIFKEKDDLICKAFQVFDSDSEEEELSNDKEVVGKTELLVGLEARKHSAEKKELEDNIENPIRTNDVNCKTDIPEEVTINEDRQTPNFIECIDIDEDSDEVLVISSDDDTSLSNFNIQDNICESNQINQLANISQDLDDRHFTLKLTLSGLTMQFKTTYKTSLEVALSELINDLRAQDKDLIITHNCKEIPLSESAYTLNLSSGVILGAIEVSTDKKTKPTANDPNEITVKLQDGNRKHTKEFKLNKTDPVSVLKQQYRQVFSLSESEQIKLIFDGDVLEDDSTPEELEIENDCVLDVKFA